MTDDPVMRAPEAAAIPVEPGRADAEPALPGDSVHGRARSARLLLGGVPDKDRLTFHMQF